VPGNFQLTGAIGYISDFQLSKYFGKSGISPRINRPTSN